MVMTPGMMRAIALIGSNRKPCAGCGFPIPKYPGRYPSRCPNCTEPLLPHPLPADDEEDAEEDEDEDAG